MYPEQDGSGPRAKVKQQRKSGESRQPYKGTACAYLQRGWTGPLPLPPRKKEKPPGGYSGRGAPYPSRTQVDKWATARPYGNICLRMPTVEIGGTAFDVVGIDVDDYDDKHGGDELADLEAQLGPLPPTLRSTSRRGVSGIRFYLAPAGHLYIGKAAPAIDIVSPGYRYAIVYPSVHPSGRRYRWFDDRHRGRVTRRIPDVRALPLLPDAWVDVLTNGGMHDEYVPVDLESSDAAILKWARDTLPGFDSKPCARMCRDAEKWVTAIADDPSSHDKIKDAHWNLLHNAAEGHTGWPAAIRRIEKAWRADVLARRKRSRGSAASEIRRSKTKALRKLKGEVDEHDAIGLQYVTTECPCAAGVVLADCFFYGPRSPRVPRKPAMPRRYA